MGNRYRGGLRAHAATRPAMALIVMAPAYPSLLPFI
jgi:hypothetical protein